jgi:hypothetical protein
MQLFIVGYRYPARFAIHTAVAFYIELHTLAYCLLTYGQGGQDENRFTSLFHDIFGPDQLYQRLAQSAVCEYRPAAFSDGPFGQEFLEVKHLIGQKEGFKPRVRTRV